MSNDDIREKRRTEILQTLDETERASAALQKQAERLGQRAQFTKDLANATRDFVKAVPKDSALLVEDWCGFQTLWLAQNDATNRMRATLEEQSYSATVATTSVASLRAVLDTTMLELRTEVREQPAFRESIEHINAVYVRDDLMPELRNVMHLLGLDERHGSIRSPLEILEEAKSAMDNPAGGAGVIGALIALREAIKAVLSDLLRRRPVQERAKAISAQVESIGKHCRYEHSPASFFVCLGADAHYVVNMLSDAKEKHFARNEQMLAFNAGLELLNGFLHELDPERLTTAGRI
jgi:hypothetical protein